MVRDCDEVICTVIREGMNDRSQIQRSKKLLQQLMRSGCWQQKQHSAVMWINWGAQGWGGGGQLFHFTW